MDKNANLKRIMTSAPVIAVIAIDDAASAVKLSKALVAGGIASVEITLRTDNALKCIEAVAKEVEGAIVGAGTVLTTQQYEQAVKVGSKFIVSPGSTQSLLKASNDHAIPFLPGAGTPSEMMALADEGLEYLKFFPAVPSGGHNFLKSIASPLPNVKFCPTGGIGPDNAKDFLSLPNVLCVGGSWVAPSNLIEAGDWEGIEALARVASQLR